MPPQLAIAIAIFLLTYLVIAVGKLPWLRIDRTGAALAGGVAMVLSGTLSQRAALSAIDFPTLALLLGMMIVVANLRISGALSQAARAVLGHARSDFAMLAVTIAAAGVLAAFFINDIVCLALTPLLIETVRARDADPLPFLLALATASNIGSVATITGNPQNMIVAGFTHPGYLGFASHMVPIAVLGLIVDYLVLAVAFRGRLRRGRAATTAIPPTHVGSKWMVAKSSAVAVGALICFALGFPTDLVALAAGVVLLFTRKIRPERVYRLVDWTLLLMFAGLFVVVAGAEATGILTAAVNAIGAHRLAGPAIFAVTIAILSNLVSNVPAVLLFKPLYPALGGGIRTGLMLAGVSTLAGNLTVVGSIANLIVIESARREGIEISFSDYLKIGVPVTILTLAMAVAILAHVP